jgi:hypothetical protein
MGRAFREDDRSDYGKIMTSVVEGSYITDRDPFSNDPDIVRGFLNYTKHWQLACPQCDCIPRARIEFADKQYAYVPNPGPNSNTYARYLIETCVEKGVAEPSGAIGWSWTPPVTPPRSKCCYEYTCEVGGIPRSLRFSYPCGQAPPTFGNLSTDGHYCYGPKFISEGPC